MLHRKILRSWSIQTFLQHLSQIFSSIWAMWNENHEKKFSRKQIFLYKGTKFWWNIFFILYRSSILMGWRQNIWMRIEWHGILETFHMNKSYKLKQLFWDVIHSPRCWMQRNQVMWLGRTSQIRRECWLVSCIQSVWFSASNMKILYKLHKNKVSSMSEQLTQYIRDKTSKISQIYIVYK